MTPNSGTPNSGTLLYRATDRFEAATIQAALQANGIPVISTEGHAIAAETGIRIEAYHVEIWVPTERLQEAARVVRECQSSAPRPNKHEWTCAKCGETIEAGFDLCWKCGAARRE